MSGSISVLRVLSDTHLARHAGSRSGSPAARLSELTDALGLAARVRDGEVSPRELVEESIARIEATNPQLNFLVTDCFEEALATEPRDGPFSGVPILDQGSERDCGRSHDVLVARVRRLRAVQRRGGRAPHQGGGIRRAREVEHARVRQHVRHRVGAERSLPQPVESGAHARRLVGRRGRGGGGRDDAARARLGRRRLDSHPCVVLRPLRHQAVARTRLPRAVRQRLARAVARAGRSR